MSIGKVIGYTLIAGAGVLAVLGIGILILLVWHVLVWAA